MRRRISILVIALTVVVALGAALAQDQKPDGTVKMQSGWITPGIGWNWGTGTLQFQGRENRFKVEGLTVGTVGNVMPDTVGEVYNLKEVDQFAGAYTPLNAGAQGQGGSITRLVNQNGVQLMLKTREGVTFKTATDGLKIKLE